MTSDPYADLPPEYLQLLREKEAEENMNSAANPTPFVRRGPTPEDEEEMDRYYSEARWLERTDHRRTDTTSEEWHPPAIGDGI